MTHSRLAAELLEATVTEDDYALWEVIGMARVRFPGASESELNARGREALNSLVRSALVRVYRRSGGQEVILTDPALSEVLAEDANWEVPGSDDGIFVASTPEGERVYNRV